MMIPIARTKQRRANRSACMVRKRKGWHEADSKRDQSNTPVIPATAKPIPAPSSINAHKKPRHWLGYKTPNRPHHWQTVPRNRHLPETVRCVDRYSRLSHGSAVSYFTDPGRLHWWYWHWVKRWTPGWCRSIDGTNGWRWVCRSMIMCMHEQASAKLRDGRKMEKKWMAKVNDPPELLPKIHSVDTSTAE